MAESRPVVCWCVGVGLAVAKRAQAPNVVALACSGYSDDAIGVTVAKAGVRGLIAKPYLADELCAAVQAAIGIRRATRV